MLQGKSEHESKIITLQHIVDDAPKTRPHFKAVASNWTAISYHSINHLHNFYDCSVTLPQLSSMMPIVPAS